MVKYCSEGTGRGLCGLADETMTCTCGEPNLAEYASLARGGLCQTDQVRCTYIYIYSPGAPPLQNPQTSKICLFSFSSCHAVFLPPHHPPPLSPLLFPFHNTHKSQDFLKKKRYKKKKNCPLCFPPIFKSRKGNFSLPPLFLSYIHKNRTAKTYSPPNSAPVPVFAAQPA